MVMRIRSKMLAGPAIISSTERPDGFIVTLPLRAAAIAPELTSRFLVRKFLPDDGPAICSWVNSSRKLAMVSGDRASGLTPTILQAWLAKSEIAIIVANANTGVPLGFSTLSVQEAHGLPVGHIEQCHLIVSPSDNYLTVGSQLCRSGRHTAHSIGYDFLCGRVSPDNPYGLLLVRRQRAKEMTGFVPWARPGFRWFQAPALCFHPQRLFAQPNIKELTDVTR